MSEREGLIGGAETGIGW